MDFRDLIEDLTIKMLKLKREANKTNDQMHNVHYATAYVTGLYCMMEQ